MRCEIYIQFSASAPWSHLPHQSRTTMLRLLSGPCRHPSTVLRFDYFDGEILEGRTWAWWGYPRGPRPELVDPHGPPVRLQFKYWRRRRP